MRKIPTLFVRQDRWIVVDLVSPGCEWVLAGEGTPTRKLDGTCCLVRDGRLYKRHEVRRGAKWPPLFEPCTELDPVTGKVQGWIPVGDGPEDKYHREAFSTEILRPDGSYELIGPKVNGNPEGRDRHVLVAHADLSLVLPDCERTYSGIRNFLEDRPEMEGIVWHHPDGRMAKIKRRDFYKI